MTHLKPLKKIWMVLMLTCACASLFAQRSSEFKTRDSLIEKSISTLHQKGVDTIAVYSFHGSVILLPNSRSDQFPNYDPNKGDPCIWNQTFLVFILWKQHGQSFFTFKCPCYDYPVKPIQDNGLWNYYLTNRTAIENSTPKQPLLKHVNLQTEEVTVGEEKTGFKETETIQLMFLVGRNKTTRNMGYMFYQQFGRWGDQNLNYDYNMNLPEKQLQLKLDALCRPSVVSKELTVASKN